MNSIPMIFAWAPMPLWLIPILLVIGVILFLAGRNNIKTRRMSLSWKQRRLWGISEVTGNKAVVGGYIRCAMGVCMVLCAIIGPFVTRALSNMERVRLAQRHQQVEKELADFGRELKDRSDALNNDMTAQMEETLGGIESIARKMDENFQAPQSRVENPSAPANTSSQTSSEPGFIDDPTRWRAGMTEGTEFTDTAPEGGILVGMRLAQGKNWDGALHAVQPIYQVGAGYALGQRHGVDGGDEHEIIARPGYAVGAIGIRDGIYLLAMQLVFYRIDGTRLNPNDRYESQWVGADGGSVISVDAQGHPITGVFGSRVQDLTSIGIHPVKQLAQALPIASEPAPDLWSEARPGKLLGLDRGNPFIDASPSQGILVGLRIFHDVEHAETICGVQPIYLTTSGYEEGRTCGWPSAARTLSVARPGYRLGGIGWEGSGSATGLQLRYTKMEATASSPDDYLSPWLGYDYNSAPRQSDETGMRVAVGIAGWFDGTRLSAISLVMLSPRVAVIPPQQQLPAEYRRAAFSNRPMQIGDPHGKPYVDEAPAGGVLVGLRCAKGTNWGGALQAIQPIYQVKDSYVLGERHGKSGGDEIEVKAEPGYAVGSIRVRAGLVVNAVQVVFYRIEGTRLNPADVKETAWIGCDGGGPGELNAFGVPITRIFGTWKEDLLSIGVQSSADLEEPLPLATGKTNSSETQEPEAELRKWTSADGRFTIEARLVSATDDTVVLRRSDGVLVKISLTKLSDAEREFLGTN